MYLKKKVFFYRAIFFVIFSLYFGISEGYGWTPPPPPPNKTPPVPIDDGIVFLFLGGLIYGLYKIKKHNRIIFYKN